MQCPVHKCASRCVLFTNVRHAVSCSQMCVMQYPVHKILSQPSSPVGGKRSNRTQIVNEDIFVSENSKKQICRCRRRRADIMNVHLTQM
jgi:hypothetical protein